MAYTDRDELERVASFTEQQQRPPTRPQDLRISTSVPGAVRCDACGAELDPALLRFRCETCPPPPLPPAATELLARLRARRDT